MGNVLVRVDVSTGTITREELAEEYRCLGGRGLIAKIAINEIDAHCDPMGHQNKLIIAPGLLGGYNIPSADRLSVGAKSPLTGGIKESNAGGTTGRALARLGIRAVVLEGKPATETLQILEVTADGCRLVSKPELKGLGIYATTARLREEYGAEISLMVIGPAGELGLRTACIANLDPEGRPTRVNGRGGLGAVMGSKGIKAVVVDARGAKSRGARGPRLTSAIKEYVDAIRSNPVTTTYREYGTAGNLALCNALGCLPIRNFSVGSTELADKIGGDRLRQIILERGGLPSHRCMPGCIIGCSNVYVDTEGREVVAPLEYETIGLLGSNCGVFDLDAIAQLNYLCNDVGVDTIEVGAALGVAMEAGLLDFGDWQGMYKVIEGIVRRELLSLVIGAGAVATGNVLNVSRVPAVKGQAMAAYDPRSLKGLGVTYATSPQGADHTAGITLRMNIDHLDPNAQVEASLRAQVRAAMVDTVGLCNFASAGLGPRLDILARLVEVVVGGAWSEGRLLELGKMVLLDEVRFNSTAGISQEGNDLPEFMRMEGLAPRDSRFDVRVEDLKRFAELLNKVC
ncbi:aldehyde ferredoxin oxidoreductase C-terminal domain-containing protein [Thermanaeromonas sp. C210]|uniref:aldehyde ferredoxin oxidoreductase C-terminal domain-containing protein n=1 Tax=Thermanaeromonas sp. C210 TaxID=2731925 RepID=UPI00155C7256|nr:aldehyde ferredoxin oxidoreductase C-terminal domain-containing protein [Thermanaeromonas sp. C210]GFN24170.1 aldehyde ferredoxin oxidoreductase [Thermanaeromonas sp. C210]